MRVVAAVVLCLILCALPAQAQTGADVQIEIFPPDPASPPTTLAFSSLGGQDLRSGHSLASVLRRAGFEPGTYDAVEVAHADGSVVAIRQAEIRLEKVVGQVRTNRYDDPTATEEEKWRDVLADRQHPVVLRSDTAGVELWRPADPTVGSETEMVFAPVEGRLTLRLVAEERLVVTPSTARPGQTVTFTATPPPGNDYATVQYEWAFGDGATDNGPDREVTHVYEGVGTRTAIVRFLRDGQVIGETSTTVYVDDPSEQGTGNADPDDRPRRRRENARKSNTDENGGSGPGDGPGTSGPETTSDDWAAPPVGSTPPPVDTSVPPPVEPVTPPPPAQPEPRPEPRRAEPAPEPEPVGETVDGYLLASADLPGGGGGAQELPEDAPEELQELARRPTEAATNGRTLPTVAWVGVGLLALLALGWALEGRRTLPYWQP